MSQLALLNLISTPAVVLTPLGLQLSIGLSSEDPMGGRHPSEPYDAYVSVYTPTGEFAKRIALGRLPPYRRRLVEIAPLVAPLNFEEPHVVVAHRVPASLADRYGVIDQPVALPDNTDYHMFRSYVQYAYPHGQGAHGGLIYEVPPRHNEPASGKPPSEVLTFTTKIVFSEQAKTMVALINYSTNPRYATTAEYQFGVYTMDGRPVLSDVCRIRPFTAGLLDLKDMVSGDAIAAARDPADGVSHFCLYGVCQNASIAVLLLALAPELGGVSIEHTHSPQGYMMPFNLRDRQRIKHEAVTAWHGLLSRARQGRPSTDGALAA